MVNKKQCPPVRRTKNKVTMATSINGRLRILLLWLFLAILMSCEKEPIIPVEPGDCWACTFYKSDPFQVIMCGYTEIEIREFERRTLNKDDSGEFRHILCTKLPDDYVFPY